MQDLLRELFHYDPLTGDLTRKVARTRGPVGSKVGSIGSDGYLKTSIKYQHFLVHRLIWMYVHGEWPSQFIDHVDGDKTNNRLDNLRAATRAQNCQNAKVRADNKLGIKGVHKFTRNEKFVATIYSNGKYHFLGHFDTPELAASAYATAAQQLHGEFAKAGLL